MHHYRLLHQLRFKTHAYYFKRYRIPLLDHYLSQNSCNIFLAPPVFAILKFSIIIVSSLLLFPVIQTLNAADISALSPRHRSSSVYHTERLPLFTTRWAWRRAIAETRYVFMDHWNACPFFISWPTFPVLSLSLPLCLEWNNVVFHRRPTTVTNMFSLSLRAFVLGGVHWTVAVVSERVCDSSRSPLSSCDPLFHFRHSKMNMISD